MCRLALLNNEGINYIQNNLGGINKLFNYLENSFGGQGNGYAVFKKDGTTVIKKGVGLKNETISQYVLKNLHEITWVMYHTRIASVSMVADSNCHPFRYGKKILMMNGTERTYDFKNSLTDTENVLRLSAENNVKLQRATKLLRSVFIGYDKGLYVTKGTGDLLLLKNKGGIVFASDFPDSYFDNNDIYEAPKMWEEGDKIVLKNLSPYVEKEKFDYSYCFNDYYTKTYEDKSKLEGYRTESYKLDNYYEELKQYYRDLDMCRAGESIDY